MSYPCHHRATTPVSPNGNTIMPHSDVITVLQWYDSVTTW